MELALFLIGSFIDDVVFDKTQMKSDAVNILDKFKDCILLRLRALWLLEKILSSE
jgi:hypothetical protein